MAFARLWFALPANTYSGVTIDWQTTIGTANDRHTVLSDRVNRRQIPQHLAQKAGQKAVILSGGSFQNTYLTTKAVNRLKSDDFKVYCHKNIPSNDGGLALGQLYAAKHIG